MDLVQKGGHAAAPASGVQVDPALRQRLGIKLAKAEIRPVARVIKTYGTVALNEASYATISPKTEGWIKSLHVSRVGQRFKAGQVLYTLYSPDLIQRQREYLETIQRRDRLKESGAEISGQTAQVAVSLAREIQRARRKFTQADVSPEALDEIERTGRVMEIIPVYAEKAGFVTKLDVREGGYVNPASPLMSVAVEDDVRIDVSLHQGDLASINDGDAALVTVPNSGQSPIPATVSIGSAPADAATRLFPVWLLLKGRHPVLKAGMSVDVQISGRPHDALVVPLSAVLHSGHGERVMVAEKDGHFLPQPITAGIEDDGFVEVSAGLTAGTEVAVRGQFLLDAAASMNDAAQRMSLAP
jgi:Cu(I)/Ag(I) efflux system membrane fusion protein